MPALAIPAFWYAVAGTATAAGAIGAAEIGSNATNHAADLQSQSNDKALDFEKQQAAADQQRFDATQHANYDQWASRQSSLSSLQQMAGLGPRVIPPYVNTSTPAGTTPPTGGAPGLTPGSDPQSALLSALNSGQKGQGFVDQFNKQFNLQPGSSLAYYPDTNTYSLAAPNGYAAVGANGQWGWNPRSGGAGASAVAQPGSLASLLYPNVQTPAALAVRTPALYQPGSLGSYV